MNNMSMVTYMEAELRSMLKPIDQWMKFPHFMLLTIGSADFFVLVFDKQMVFVIKEPKRKTNKTFLIINVKN
jgi:hypothetical protein